MIENNADSQVVTEFKLLNKSDYINLSYNNE